VINLEVTIIVSSEVAAAIQQKKPQHPGAEELLRIAETLGVSLEPIHPGTVDTNLLSYFIVKVPDSATALKVMDRLQQSKAVEAAYIKPPDELP
jgi:hypothetical protein